MPSLKDKTIAKIAKELGVSIESAKALIIMDSDSTKYSAAFDALYVKCKAIVDCPCFFVKDSACNGLDMWSGRKIIMSLLGLTAAEADSVAGPEVQMLKDLKKEIKVSGKGVKRCSG